MAQSTPKARPEPSPSSGLAAKLLSFCDELRNEGVKIGTSELLDALNSLGEISWTSEPRFRAALAACLAKSQEDRAIFDALYDRFFFRAVEAQALEYGVEAEPEAGERVVDIDDLRAAVQEAIRNGRDGQMRDLARLAIAMLGREGEGGGESTGVIGVDVQRLRRALGLVPERSGAGQPQGDRPAPEGEPLPRENVRRFERQLRRELERALIERTGALPPARPLNELDRALPSAPLQDLATVHRVVAQLKRRLATQGHELRGRRRSAHVDIRRTLRASLETGGVPLRLKYRSRRPRRPEIYVLCDVSTSVSSASVFFLSVLHALHDSFRRLRSFVFIERISEVTEIFERERNFTAISERVSREGGVADISGYTDYGRVWQEFLAEISDDLDPRSTVIVLGDARTNGREPHAAAFGQIAARAGRTFWLNPEPNLYWNYGDSVIAAYEPHCDGVFECWTAKQLEGFVKALTTQRAAA